MFPVARAVLLSMRERDDFVCVLKTVCGWTSKNWLLPYACCGLHFIDFAACVLSFDHSTPLQLYQHYLCQTAPEVSITMSIIITVTVSVLSVRLHLKCTSVSIIITVTVSLSVLPLSDCTWSVYHSIHHYNCYCYQYYLCQTAPEMAITASIIITVTVSVLSVRLHLKCTSVSIIITVTVISITSVRLHLKWLSQHPSL